MAMQSRHDRLKRLSEGRCPIHGLSMVQVGLVDVSAALVECPRRDCGIRGTATDPDGVVSLLPEHESLLGEARP